MGKNLMRMVLSALVTGTAWALLHEASQRRQTALRLKAKPRAVQTWEGEGGALPVTGSQMGPDPSLPVAKFDPAGQTVL